jgi:hypothetical protein
MPIKNDYLRRTLLVLMLPVILVLWVLNMLRDAIYEFCSSIANDYRGAEIKETVIECWMGSEAYAAKLKKIRDERYRRAMGEPR